MPVRTLRVPVPVQALIRHLHPDLKRKVRSALTDILERPECGKSLKGELQSLWSLRVGRHRIIYRPDQAGADIVAIGPRRTIYEDTSRRLSRARQ